ncbi:lycopene cyclase domain-containing protein [Chitinophaga rhizosphaerae]|uniref:lycopene cyclase domain-containing protein n=1 Tax=Chitinophaga rhizosphaerae TaxID=1864947 RepID=UPI000F811D2C|nr:lycopene cyclase domain-containing protein [Chitinophaga rhizosphaerae]
MPLQYTYLLLDFLTVIICFIFSFDRRIRFDRHFGAFLKAVVLVSIPFLGWDVLFTRMGVWWFNDVYTVGLRFAGLPLEEWLFFICIPFACVFTWYCLDKFFDLAWTNALNNIIVFVAITVCLLAALLEPGRWYTLVTAVATALVLLYMHFVAKWPQIGQVTMVYLLLMPGFFAVNGVLTGTGLANPVVNYDPEEMLNIRVRTIPVEDFVYGYAQFLLNVYFFEKFKIKS